LSEWVYVFVCIEAGLCRNVDGGNSMWRFDRHLRPSTCEHYVTQWINYGTHMHESCWEVTSHMWMSHITRATCECFLLLHFLCMHTLTGTRACVCRCMCIACCVLQFASLSLIAFVCVAWLFERVHTYTYPLIAFETHTTRLCTHAYTHTHSQSHKRIRHFVCVYVCVCVCVWRVCERACVCVYVSKCVCAHTHIHPPPLTIAELAHRMCSII